MLIKLSLQNLYNETYMKTYITYVIENFPREKWNDDIKTNYSDLHPTSLTSTILRAGETAP